jgi:hypothetical protein
MHIRSACNPNPYLYLCLHTYMRLKIPAAPAYHTTLILHQPPHVVIKNASSRLSIQSDPVRPSLKFLILDLPFPLWPLPILVLANFFYPPIPATFIYWFLGACPQTPWVRLIRGL